MSPEQLTVVIPTRQRWPVLARTLQALGAQSVSGFGVCVVVDGEDQQVPPLPGCRVLQVPRGGPGAARNAGARAVDTPLVLFLGDDMVPRPDLVARHLSRHAPGDAPGHAVLGHVCWHPEVARTPLLAWMDRTGMQFDYAGIAGKDAGWGRFYSCNVSLQRAWFLAQGGFDPAFAYYYEDLDAGLRLHRAGLRLRYEPQALADHLHRYDSAGYARRLTGIAEGELQMVRRHPQVRPFFADRFARAESAAPVSPLWRHAAARRLPGPLAARADLAWDQHFAGTYLTAYEAGQELAELQEHLGAGFDLQQLQGHRQAVDAEEHAAPDEATFYRTSTAYLYDLTVFAMSGTKRPYRAMVRRVAPPGGRLLDYGCGIGSDGLRLQEDGYQVSFADFDNPSVAYLRSRLQRRGAQAPVYDIERYVPGGHDVVYSFDVLEHVQDPFAFLARLEQLAAVVVVNLLAPVPDDVHVHKPLPLPALLRYVQERGLISYRLLHGRSHLVAYRGTPASARDRWVGRARRARDVLRRPADLLPYPRARP